MIGTLRSQSCRHAAIRLCSLLFGACLLLSVQGCGSADPRYFTLAPLPGAAQPGGGPAAVEVRTVAVSQRLDRDTIVRGSGNYVLKTASGDSWSEPLGTMVAQTLAEDLSQRLPGTTVFSQSDTIALTPQAYVELSLTSFDADASDYVVLRGILSVHDAGDTAAPAKSVPVYWRSPRPVRGGTASFVASLSQGLAALSDQTAQLLRQVPAPLNPL